MSRAKSDHQQPQPPAGSGPCDGRCRLSWLVVVHGVLYRFWKRSERTRFSRMERRRYSIGLASGSDRLDRRFVVHGHHPPQRIRGQLFDERLRKPVDVFDQQSLEFVWPLECSAIGQHPAGVDQRIICRCRFGLVPASARLRWRRSSRTRNRAGRSSRDTKRKWHVWRALEADRESSPSVCCSESVPAVRHWAAVVGACVRRSLPRSRRLDARGDAAFRPMSATESPLA